MKLKWFYWLLVACIVMGVVTVTVGVINPEVATEFDSESGLAVNTTGWLFSVACWGGLLAVVMISALRPEANG